MPGQTVQTQIRLLLEQQSDQGLHCLPFRLHRLDSLFIVEPHSSNFRVITTNFWGIRLYRKFMVTWQNFQDIVHRTNRAQQNSCYNIFMLHKQFLIITSCESSNYSNQKQADFSFPYDLTNCTITAIIEFI